MRPSSGAGRPWSWVLWHPHEKLWNWDLLRVFKRALHFRPLYRPVAAAIVLVDTTLLCGRAISRRVARTGVASLFRKAKLPPGASLLYLDLGTHKEARELLLMADRILPRLGGDFRAIGFEASRECYQEARRHVAGRDRVTLVNAALCREAPPEGYVRLYRDAATGLGSSLYRGDGTEYEEVDALRLSDWIRDAGVDLERTIVLMRMNIEGAEYDVIRDLVESGVARSVDGWFGMWDDVAKADVAADREFRELLARAGISPFTFNGRDFLFPPRLACIAYDIDTAVLAALRGRKALEAGQTRE